MDEHADTVGIGGEFRSTTEPKVGRISANTFKHKEVRYSALEGIAIFEGDIALGTVTQIEAVSNSPEVRTMAPQGIRITGNQFRWPKGQVPYRIDPALPNQKRVTDAIAHWEAKTPVRFVAVTAANLNQFPNRILFASKGGCWSHVGMQGGEQTISLGDSCTLGNAIHEIGHAMGLWHEQSREDRDKFVTINHQNIIPGMEHNFDQHINDGDDVGNYDYGSIMHYPADAFSKNKQPTIVAKNGAAIGQRQGLSAGDIGAIQSMYAGGGSVTPPPFPGRLLKYPPVMQGPDVLAWQQRMTERGFTLKVDGLYGQESKAVCTAFQKHQGIQADGIVGPVTWERTFAAS